MADLRIEFQGAAQLQAALARAPEVVNEELQRFMAEATMHLRTEVIDRTPAAAGTLRASISTDWQSTVGGMLGVVGTPQPYAIPVELGTRPHMPPVQPIQDWVRQKLGLSGKEGRSVAFAIARKISKVGTKGHFMFRDAFNDNAEEVQRQFDQTVSRIVARIGGPA